MENQSQPPLSSREKSEQRKKREPGKPGETGERKPRCVDSWLTLSLVPGMTSRLYNHLLDRFPDPETILTCSHDTLVDAGIKPGWARKLVVAGTKGLPPEMESVREACLGWLEDKHHTLLTRHCDGYPTLLSEIPDPPPLLYLAGNPGLLATPMLAIVGSRHPSAGGRQNAFHFAQELAAAGIGIASGLALGIDVASHEGALDAGGATIAVLGTGVDRIYPASNRGMFERISGTGALLSEFCPGTPPVPANFPRRNRIISGLSHGVLVVEASLRSGSMITARCALEQGREVFAIPGSIHNPMARGCHRLIADGAKLVECVADIIEECPGFAAENFHFTQDKRPGKAGDPKLQGETAVVKNAIGYDPVSLDELVRTTGLEVQQTSVALIELELMGIICKENTGYVLSTA